MTHTPPPGSIAGSGSFGYERDGTRIYAQSFAMIRAESNLEQIPASLEPAIVRAIHATGDTSIADKFVWSPSFTDNAQQTLISGGCILCDTNMVSSGITRIGLPSNNPVHCFLGDKEIPDLAKTLGTTRTAAAVTLWPRLLSNALVVIGNAPTALFQLLEGLEMGWPQPRAIIAVPVGFVGAAESKQALVNHPMAPPYLSIPGRRGGSPIATAIVNGLCGQR